jgi:hypothetical protein
MDPYELLIICSKLFVDVGCCSNHILERILDVRAATDQRTQQEYHSFVVKNGEVYKQTTKG